MIRWRTMMLRGRKMMMLRVENIEGMMKRKMRWRRMMLR